MLPKSTRLIRYMLDIGNSSALPPLEHLARKIYNFDLWMGVLLPLIALVYFLSHGLIDDGGYSPFVIFAIVFFFLFCLILNSIGYYIQSVYLSLIVIFGLVITTPMRAESWFEPLLLIPVGINAFIYLPHKRILARAIFLFFVISGTVSFFLFLNLDHLTPEVLQEKIPVFRFTLTTFVGVLTYKAFSLILLYQLSMRESQANESRYRDLFENSYDGIVRIDSKANIVDANKAGRRLLNIEKGEKISLKKLTHPEDIEKALGFYEKLKEEGYYSGYQGRVNLKNGGIRHIEVNSVALKDAQGNFIGSHDIVRDITEKKKTETALRLSEKRFRRIFEVSSVGILVADISVVKEQMAAMRETGHDDILSLVKRQPHLLYSSFQLVNFIDCNDKLLELVGLPNLAEFKRKFRYLLKPQSLWEFIEEAQAILKREDHFEGELTLQSAAGDEKILLYSVNYPKDGDMTQVVYTFIDITDKKHNERELTRHVEELTKANEELDSFVYKVAHDLRAPLTNVVGLINLAIDDENVKGAETYLHLQKKSVERMDAFIRDVVDFTRNVRQEVAFAEVNIEEIIDEVISMQQESMLGNQVQIFKELEAGPLYSDPMRIRIILNNLISNALLYHDDSKALSQVKISTKFIKGSCRLIVEDNGKGIDLKYQKKVFDMFFRADSKTKGSGLGLYIVKEVAEKIGAEIQLESERHVFTRFSLIFPYTPNPPQINGHAKDN